MAADSNRALDEQRSLIRQVRQRLESLARSGLREIATPGLRNPPEAERVAGRPSRAQPEATTRAATPVANPATTHAQSSRLGTGDKVDSSPPSRPTHSEQKAGDRPARGPARPAPSVPLPSASVGSLFERSGFDTPALPASERPAALAAVASQVAICTRCPHLAATRTQTVFGTGSPSARLMFIGEAPGVDEDRLGEPFVGRAGQLLTDMITKGMGLTREEVYIANVLKCRPPENRAPSAEEAANCTPYLEQQIALIRPEFLCLLGKSAAMAVLEIAPSATMGHLRGKWHRYRGIPTLITYHPSYLLRTPSAKKDSWEDLQILMNAMGVPIPRRSHRSTDLDPRHGGHE
jgi:DNA polymerase